MFTISTRVRYGLRSLVELAKAHGREPLSLHVISKRLGLSFKYLENIFMLLKRGGMVRGTRGPEGGYVLVGTPEDLSVLQIVTALEGPLFSNECTDDGTSCSLPELCPLRDLWGDLQKTVGDYLAARTLAGLVDAQVPPDRTMKQPREKKPAGKP